MLGSLDSWLVACLIMATTVHSFAPPPMVNMRTSRQQVGRTSIRPLSATVQEKERMTVEDEAILFGNSAEEPHPAASSKHRKKDIYGNLLPDPEHKQNPLDHSTNDPLINKLNSMRASLESCPELWMELAQHCPEKRALLDEHLCDDTVDVTFADMARLVQKSAAIFANLGVRKGVNVAILGENSARWLMADHGIQLAGGASAVRGADAPVDELRYIYEHSDSAGVAVVQGPKLLQKLAKDAKAKGLSSSLGLSNPSHGPVKTVILMHREKKSNDEIAQMAQELGVEIAVFADLLDQVEPLEASRLPKLTRNDVATIVYTSGTTGRPKGVMLTHGNLLHQTGHRLAPTQPFEESEPLPGDLMVALLPVWHITERSFELWMAARGCTVVYSSIRHFKNDLAKHKPQWMVLVPRVLEKIATGVQDKFSSGSLPVKLLSKFFTAVGKMAAKHQNIVDGMIIADEPPNGLEKLISKAILTLIAPFHALGQKLVWSKVQDGFGGRLKTIIAGGSALAGSLETFYETAGVKVCVGYGLTECSPLITYRRSDANLVAAGAAGMPCIDTEVRICDPDSKAIEASRPALPTGEVGVILARGPQIMKGYYKNKEATEKAIDQFGWFDTGDLGRINPATGDLILTGRAKDTIVLSNGENIEPTPIEDAILGECPLVEQVMLTGQDGRRLVAITVLHPTELAEEGFLDKEEAKILQDANDKVNDPQCSDEDCAKYSKILREATNKIRKNVELKKTVTLAMNSATWSFRKWEQVGDVCLTLEPFAMANGQLTQSYKVKRDSVLERYVNELP